MRSNGLGNAFQAVSMEVTVAFCACSAGTAEQLALDLIALIVTMSICSHARNPGMVGPSTSSTYHHVHDGPSGSNGTA